MTVERLITAILVIFGAWFLANYESEESKLQRECEAKSTPAYICEIKQMECVCE